MIKFTYDELLDLIAFCRHDIKQTENIIQHTNPQDTDFIDAMQEDISKKLELIKKLKSLISTTL